MSQVALEVAHELIDALLVLGLTETSQVGIEGRDDRAFVAEIDLDLAEVLALLKKMSRVGVAQGVDMGCLFDAAGFEGETEGALESGAAHRLGGRGSALTAVASGWEKQGGMLVGFPQLPQPF